MNQKGWGLKDFIFILGIIFLALLITTVIYKRSFSKKEEPITEVKENNKVTYEELEDKLKLAAFRYQNENYQGNLESDETWVLTYDLLRSEGFLKEKLMDIKDTTKECTGYVVFDKDGAQIVYTPYIKCADNYMTKGYSSENEK